MRCLLFNRSEALFARGVGGIVLVVHLFALVAFDGNAKRAEEADILRGEGFASFNNLRLRCVAFLARLCLDLVQADRRLEHQEHIESLAANVLHHARNLFGLGDGLMDRLSQLLDQLAHPCIHSRLLIPHQGTRRLRRSRFAPRVSPYLTSDDPPGQTAPPRIGKFHIEPGISAEMHHLPLRNLRHFIQKAEVNTKCLQIRPSDDSTFTRSLRPFPNRLRPCCSIPTAPTKHRQVPESFGSTARRRLTPTPIATRISTCSPAEAPSGW